MPRRSSIKQDESARIKKMYQFFRKPDDLDSAIAEAIESFLEAPLELSMAQFSPADFAGSIHRFPLVHTLISAEFFLRVTLHFRLLCRFLDLHLVTPVTGEMTNSIPLSNEEREGPRRREQIWLLEFLGASAKEITEILN